MDHTQSIAYEKWPVYDPSLIEDETIEIPIMVNGKVRSKIRIAADSDEATVERAAMSDEKVAAAIAGKKITHKKYVPKKIYTIAVG